MMETDSREKSIFVVPEYAKNTNIGEERRKMIVMSLGFSDGDGRKEWVFKKICEYSVEKKNAKIVYNDFIGWLIVNSDLIKGENNIRVALLKTMEVLVAAHYCLVNKDASGEISFFILTNPIGKMCSDFLENFYAKSKSYDYRQSFFLHSMAFINIPTLSSQLGLDKNDVSKVVSSVSLNAVLKKSLKEVCGTELAQIDVNIPGLAHYQLLMSSTDDFKLFLRESIFAFLSRTLDFSVSLKKKIADKIGVELDQLKIDQGNASSWVDAYVDTVKEVEDTGENFFERHFFKEAAKKEMKTKVEVFYIKVLALVKAIDIFSQNEEKERKEAENLKENISFLVKKHCMEMHRNGFRDFFDVRVFDDMILSGRELPSLYSKEELLQKLQMEDPSFVYFSGVSKFSYKNLLISGFYSEINHAKEAMRGFLKGVVRSEAKMQKVRNLREIAKKKVTSQMSYVLYFMKNFVAKNERDLEEQLFLSQEDMRKFEIDEIEGGRERMGDQAAALKFTLFQEGDIKKPIENSEIILNDAELKKLISESGDVLDEGLGSLIDSERIGIFGILFLPFKVILSLFGLGKKEKKKNGVLMNKKSPSSIKTKNTLSLSEIHEKFPGAPKSKEDFTKQMIALERQWNSILVEPRKLIPEWDSLNAVERRAKQPIIDREEARLRESERQKLAAIIKKYRSKISFKEFDEPLLRNLCEKIVNEISVRTNKKALQEYIFLYILNDVV